MNQEFKDRVANLLIDARVNAVLAEAFEKLPIKDKIKEIARRFRKQGRPGEKQGENRKDNPNWKGAPSFRNPKGKEDEIIDDSHINEQPMAEGNRSKALANATDPAKINKLQATSDKARFNKALDNNKPGNVALNQMLSKKKGVVESSKLMAEDNKKKPMIKINHKGPIGYKIADIGPGRTEHNVRTGDGWKEPTDKPKPKPSSPKS
jgi:hypothetical protein